MIGVFESGSRRRLCFAANSLADAIAMAETTYDIVHLERDEDHPGEAADFLTRDGRVFAIEPCRRTVH